MIANYKQSLISLLSILKIVHNDPQRHWEKCLPIQLSLIQKLSYIESRIRKIKKETKDLVILRRSKAITRDEAQILKIDIENRTAIKCDYQRLLIVFRAIGDGLAMSYIDKWDLKPVAFNQSSGFISGKKGAYLERKILRKSFEIGRMAILNDLTNVLRHGDITIPSDGFPHILEVKSGKSQNARTVRQFNKLNTIMEYLITDKIKGLYDNSDTLMVRRACDYPEKDHLREINRLIYDSERLGSVGKKIEPGLYYFVSRSSSNHPSIIEFIESIHSLQNPIVVFINATKYDHIGYYPFTLSIERPEDIYSFYAGELFIFVIVDFKKFNDMLKTHGYVCDIVQDDWMINVRPLNGEEVILKVSEHLFSRIFFEFLSLKWMIKNIISYLEKDVTV